MMQGCRPTSEEAWGPRSSRTELLRPDVDLHTQARTCSSFFKEIIFLFLTNGATWQLRKSPLLSVAPTSSWWDGKPAVSCSQVPKSV